MRLTLLKQLMPRSLFYRSLLIFLLPTLLIIGISTFIFYERHWETVHRYMASALAGEVTSIADLAAGEETRDLALVNALRYYGLQAHWQPGMSLLPEGKRIYPVLYDELARRIMYDFAIDSSADDEDIVVSIALPDGLLTLTTTAKRVTSPTTGIFIAWMLGAALLFGGIAMLFLRNQIRPILQLSDAAEAFGRGMDMTGFKPSGATEVRRAGRAFLIMRERIRKQVEERTHMLAAISHDLRTPLTRMKLQLAMMAGQDEAVEELQHDAVEMEAMIQAYLDFVRGQERLPLEKISIKSWLEQLARNYERQGRVIELDCPPSLYSNIRKQAMQRALTNILDNALRYGERVRLSCRKQRRQLVMVIEDDGPGIPEEVQEKMFQPFQRGEAARTTEGGSVGLGLSIARDVIVHHGGSISLGRSEFGGLKVEIKLPL